MIVIKQQILKILQLIKDIVKFIQIMMLLIQIINQVFSKCKYDNCKKNINSDFDYCQNHKFVCKKIIVILEY